MTDSPANVLETALDKIGSGEPFDVQRLRRVRIEDGIEDCEVLHVDWSPNNCTALVERRA